MCGKGIVRESADLSKSLHSSHFGEKASPVLEELLRAIGLLSRKVFEGEEWGRSAGVTEKEGSAAWRGGGVRASVVRAEKGPRTQVLRSWGYLGDGRKKEVIQRREKN